MDMLDDEFFDFDEDLLNATGYFGGNDVTGKFGLMLMQPIH